MRGEGDTCTWEIYVLLLGGWEGEQSSLLTSSFFFTCLQLKTILMPKWHILQWHVPIPSVTGSPLAQVRGSAKRRIAVSA